MPFMSSSSSFSSLSSAGTDEIKEIISGPKFEDLIPPPPNHAPPDVQNAELGQVQQDDEGQEDPELPWPDLDGLALDIYWKKEVTKALIGGRNVLQFPVSVVRKALREDQTELKLIDLEEKAYIECEILHGKRPQVERYLGMGWYDYAKSKMFKVGDLLLFHYYTAEETLYVRLVRKNVTRNG